MSIYNLEQYAPYNSQGQINPVLQQMQERINQAGQAYQQSIQAYQQALPQVQQFLQNPTQAPIPQIVPQSQQQTQSTQPKYDSQMLKDFECDPETVALSQEYFWAFMMDKFGGEFYKSEKGKAYTAVLNDRIKQYEKAWAKKQNQPQQATVNEQPQGGNE